MVDSTSTDQEQVQLQKLSSSFRPDLNSAARTTFGVPEAPVGGTEVIPEQVVVQDIRTVSPAPTANDLRTPNMDLEYVLNDELPSAWSALKVGVAPTGRDWWASYKDSKRFTRDPLFNPKELADQFFQEHGMLSEQENEYLNKAVRYEDLEYRKQKVLEKRVDDKIAADRPWITGAAGLLDIDVVTAFAPPVYGATKVGTTAKVTARAAQAAAAGTAATLTNQALEDYSTRTEDERDMDTVMFGLVGFLTDVNRVQKATTASTTASTAAPSTPVPPQVTFTPMQSGVRTEVVPPELGALNYEPLVKANVSVRAVLDEVTANTANMVVDSDETYAARNALVDKIIFGIGDATRVPPKAEDTVSGSIAAVHGSKVENLKFSPNWNATDNAGDKSYFDNVFGDDVVYIAEDVSWTPRTPEEAADMRMPFYEHVYDVDANFNKAFVLTPDSAPRLGVLVGDNSTGVDIVSKLRSSGYDGLIIRDMPEDYNAVRALSKISGLSDDVLQNQVVVFKPSNLSVVGARSGRALGNTLQSASSTVGVGVRTQYQVPPSTATTVQNPLGYGVLTQTHVSLPQHVQASLAQATVQVATNLKPVSKPKGAPTEWFKKYPMLSKMTSSADELWMYTQGDQGTVVNKLLANVHTEGDNVASAQASYLNNYGYALASVEQALADAVPEITNVSSNIITRTSGKYSEASQEVMDMFQDSMQKLDQVVLEHANKNNGTVLSDDSIKALVDKMSVPDAMKHVLKTYIDSGFATKIYDDAAANGFFEKAGMDAIIRRPTYMPLQHNYERMHNLVRDGKATWDDIYKYYGTQIARIYPELLQPNFAKAGRTYAAVKQGAKTATTNPFTLTVKQIGEHFVQTQREPARGLSDVTSSGMGRETLHDMLTRAGISSDDAAKAVTEIFEQQAQKQSNPKNLRRRMDWDWNFKMTASTGEVLDLGKLTGGSVYHNVENYSRRMAHLNGLAQYGLSEQTLKELLEGYLDKLPRGVDTGRAKAFMEKIVEDLTGKPTGGQVSQSIRSMQAIADPMLLANSGLFGLVDLATQTMRVGLIRSFPHIYKGLKAAFTGMKGMSKENAKDLEEIFTGKAMQGSRWKNFITHYSDNFSVDGGIHESAQYYGQSARFMNLSESVKRVQIGILMGTYIRAIRGAADGVENHVNFLRTKMQMPDDLIDGIRTEWAKHGEKIDDWDAAVRIPMEQKVFHESDNLAFTIQKGEIPAILEHDAVGKVIFPYMSYAFAMNQKVLRRVWNRDGAAGLTILMAAQFPIAMMVAASINVRKGEEPDKDLAMGTLRAMTTLGIWNYPMELLMNGVGSNGVTAMTPFSKTYNLVGDIISGDVTPRSIKENTVLNSAVFLDPLIAAMEE